MKPRATPPLESAISAASASVISAPASMRRAIRPAISARACSNRDGQDGYQRDAASEWVPRLMRATRTKITAANTAIVAASRKGMTKSSIQAGSEAASMNALAGQSSSQLLQGDGVG